MFNLQRLLVEKMEQRILVGTVAFLATMAIVGWLAINEGGRMMAFQRQFNARSIERGAALFANNCTRCHMPDGRGGSLAPALNSPYLFGHDYFGDLDSEQARLEAEAGNANTTAERGVEITTRLAAIDTERTVMLTQIQTGLQNIPGQYNPNAPSRLTNLGWGGGLYNFVYTTLVHGRPVSSAYWPQAMAAWSQSAGGPLRADQLGDLTNFILNWDKGDNWTLDDLFAVRQFPIVPVDPSTVVASDFEAIGQDVPVILEELGNLQGDPQRGQILYTGALACAGCHINAAIAPLTEGTWTRVNEVRLADPANADKSPEYYVVESIVAPNNYISPGYPAGVMPANFGDRLTYQDMADLLAYIRSQDGPIQ